MNEGKHIPAPSPVGEENRMQRELCPDAMTTEAGCDYTLPDYLPEIRKILSVRTEVLPAAPYEGGGGVELGGTVRHGVLYADGEGRLQALPLHADYSFTLPTEGESTGVFSDVAVEGTVCRLGGPRKISLRTRLSGRTRLLYEEEVAPEIRGMGSDSDRESLETLSERVESARMTCGRSPELALSASLPLECSGADTRAVWSGGGVLVNECRAEADGMLARGEVYFRVLLSEGEGSPYVLRERIPFECRIAAPGVREGESCVAHGRLLTADVSILPAEGEECGRVAIDLTLELEGCAMGKQSCIPTTALYSTAYDMTCHHRTLAYHRPLGVAMGHYTVSGSRGRVDCDGEDAGGIVDAHGRVELGSVSLEGGRAVVTGRVLADLIFTAPPEGESALPMLLSAPIECPFRIETDLRIEGGVSPAFVCHAELISARGRIEERALGVDCEVALWLRAYEKKEKTVLASAEPAGAVATHGGGHIHVAYPQKGESLFSLGARYHKKRAALARANGLPDTALARSAEPASLDGVHHLIIED